MLLAVGISEGKIWVPDCGFRRIIGVPCPGCGATGSLTFIASGQWWSAMKSSPLVALSVVMALFAVPLTLVNAVSSRSCVFSNRLGRARLCWIMAGLVFANWAYLILVG